jgi:hypothetical protein
MLPAAVRCGGCRAALLDVAAGAQDHLAFDRAQPDLAHRRAFRQPQRLICRRIPISHRHIPPGALKTAPDSGAA